MLDHGGPIGPQAAKVLHGTWLGHPLHAVLTDVPIGSWSAAAVLDLLEQNRSNGFLRRGADAAIMVGLVGATVAAVTGLADWSKIGRGRARRIGLVHGMLNATATACYLSSLCFRLGGARHTGRQLASLGYILSSTAAYLGGHLVYKERLGTDHSAGFSPPRDFVPVLTGSELQENQLRRVDVNGTSILLVRRGEHIYGIAERCSHLGGPLSEGTLQGNAVRCPWHGSCFSLADGRVLEGPSVHRQPVVDVRVRDDKIEVRGTTIR
jgi:nitrite reductase/ring-hydroxylating ferredoxin subunit/uncharacterized membrane protein